MQKWLTDNNNILMYSTYNEGKSVVAQKFIRTMKDKIYKKVTANHSKYRLDCLNKLVDQYDNTYHRSTDDVDYSIFTEEIKTNHKVPKFKVITKYKNNFNDGYTKNWSRKMFVIDYVLKINPWTHKVKDLNREKIIGSFYQK